MGETAGPLPPLRKPRHHAAGQDTIVTERPRRVPKSAPALLVQGMRPHIHIRTRGRASRRPLLRRHRDGSGAVVRPETVVVPRACVNARATTREIRVARHVKQLGVRIRRSGEDSARGIHRPAADVAGNMIRLSLCNLCFTPPSRSSALVTGGKLWIRCSRGWPSSGHWPPRCWASSSTSTTRAAGTGSPLLVLLLT